jgi:hypothetical protein
MHYSWKISRIQNDIASDFWLFAYFHTIAAETPFSSLTKKNNFVEGSEQVVAFIQSERFKRTSYKQVVRIKSWSS